MSIDGHSARGNMMGEVVSLTEDLSRGTFLSLYAYGSAVRGDSDGWSDIDVFLIARDGPEALQQIRQWMPQIYARFNHHVDPIALRRDDLAEGVPDEYAGFIWGLRNHSRLLWGEAIIEQFPLPSIEQLQRAAVQVALLCTRRLYAIAREHPLPDTVPIPDADRCQECPAGNFAWQLATTATQSLRALLVLEGGGFCESRSRIAAQLRSRGDADLASRCDMVNEIRERVPRVGAIADAPAALEALRESVPMIYLKLRLAMGRSGLTDPTHEPETC